MSLRWSSQYIDASKVCKAFDSRLVSVGLANLTTQLVDELKPMFFDVSPFKDTISWLFASHLLGSWLVEHFDNKCKLFNVLPELVSSGPWQGGSPVHGAAWRVALDVPSRNATSFWQSILKVCSCGSNLNHVTQCLHGSGHGVMKVVMMPYRKASPACSAEPRPGAHLLYEKRSSLLTQGIQMLKSAPGDVQSYAVWGFYEEFFKVIESNWPVSSPTPRDSHAIAACSFVEYYPQACFFYAFEWIALVRYVPRQGAITLLRGMCDTVAMREDNRQECKNALNTLSMLNEQHRWA